MGSVYIALYNSCFIQLSWNLHMLSVIADNAFSVISGSTEMEEQEISETGQDGAADSTVQLKQWNPGQDPDQWGANACQISERQFRKVSQSQSISSRWDTYTCEIKEHQSRKVSRWDGSVPWAFFWKNLSPCNTLTKVSYKLSGIKILSVSQKKDVSSIKIHNLWWVWSQSIRLKNQNLRKFLVLFFLKLTDNLIIVWLIWGLHLWIICVFQ